MPCSCEGYSPSDDVYKQKQEAHEMCCQAQWVAHKLGQLLEAYELQIPDNLLFKLAQHRRILLNHKKDELQKDIDKARGEVGIIESKIKKITSLGGIPTEATMNDLDVASEKLKSLRSIDQNTLLG